MAAPHLSKAEFVALLAALTMVDALAIDIMLPALPDIGETLAVANPNDRSLVLMTFALGFGLSQIVFGPLSDRYGRRAPILVGMVFYILCSLLCVVAPSFGILLAIRFVQGIAAASIKVAVSASIRDRYVGSEMAEVNALILSIFLLVPIIMPSAGQVLLLVGPWQLIFLAMAGLAVLIGGWSWLRLGDTLDPANRRPLSYSGVTQGFALVFTNRRAFFYGSGSMFVQGALLSMIFTGQQVFVEVYDWGVYYPLTMVAMAGSASLCSLVAARVLGRIGLRRCAHGAMVALPIITLTGALLAMTVGLSGWAYLAICCLLAPCFVASFASSGALSMEPLGAVAGTATAVFGLMVASMGTVFSYVVQQAFDGTTVPVLAGMGILGLCALGFFSIAENGRLFGRDQAPVAATSAT